MPEIVCPDCQAAIERDRIAQSGRAECPFCGADLSEIGWPQPAESGLTGSEDRSEAGAGTLELSGEQTRALPALPDKSRIRVVESTPDRLVLFIPGGGKRAAGLGCFAICWLGFMCVFTPLMAAGILKDGGGDGPPLVFVVPFLGVFWVVGLGMAFFWVKFKYERTFLLLDRERIVIQKTLFRRKRLEETPLRPDSRAELVESYQQNEEPVYRVEVRGAAGSAKFGTGLGDEDKDWLVDRINDFLGVAAEPNSEVDSDDSHERRHDASRQASRAYPNDCEKCGAPLAGRLAEGVLTCAHCGAVHRGRASASPPDTSDEPRQSFARLTPEMLPADSGIRILASSPEALAFRLAAPSQSLLRWIVPLFTFPFAMAWYSFIFFFAWNVVRAPFGWFGILPLLFLIPFVVAGLLPLGLGLYAIAGSTTVTVTRERLACRWGVGPWGYTRHVPTARIDSVRLEDFSTARHNRRVRSPRIRSGSARAGIGESPSCVVRAAGKTIPLTLMQDVECSRRVAALVRTRLEEQGHALSDV